MSDTKNPFMATDIACRQQTELTRPCLGLSITTFIGLMVKNPELKEWMWMERVPKRHVEVPRCQRSFHKAGCSGPMSNDVQIAASLDFQQRLE